MQKKSCSWLSVRPSVFLFITLYMFPAPHAQHQERQIVSIQPLVTVCMSCYTRWLHYSCKILFWCTCICVACFALQNFTFCWPCIMQWFLVNDNVMHKFLSMYLFFFITLYMFWAPCAHHQERQIVWIQLLVTACHVIQDGFIILVQFVLMFLYLYICVACFASKQNMRTVTRGCIDTICLSWWWAWGARNM